MHLRINKSSQVYRYWKECRDRAGIRPILSQGAIIILAYLNHHGEAHQLQIAQENDLDQGNLSSNHMQNLVKMRMVHMMERPGLGAQGGGRPAKVYQISPNGRRFLQLLSCYDGQRTLLTVMQLSPYFARINSSIASPTNLSGPGLLGCQ
jgi:DNA-binding MarR family transcriptional regulator